MSTTVSPPSAHLRLATAASVAALTPILQRLAVHAQVDRETNFLGVLVSFLATGERLGMLAGWSPDNDIALELERLGRVAWADFGLIRKLRPIGDEHLVRTEFRGFIESHYLVAMAGTRRAVPPREAAHADTVAFVERLRLLLLIRSVEASEAGVVRDANLKLVCDGVRQVCDQDNHSKWVWLSALVHPIENVTDFVEETRHKCQVALAGKTRGGAERQFMWALVAVLDRDLKSLDEPPATASRPALRTRPPDPTPAWPFADIVLGDEAIATVHLPQELHEAQAFAVVAVDTSRPPPAQREQATGLMLQSLEDSQYLRHSWHRLSVLEEAELLKRLAELLQSADMSDRLGAALIALAALTSMPVSGVDRLPLTANLGDDWGLDLVRGDLHRRPPRFARRWHADGRTTRSWVRTLAEKWSIHLPENMLRPLRDASRGGSAVETLADLWRRCNDQVTLEAWFGKRFASIESLSRLTSPAVALALGQQVFDLTRDHVAARLVASNSRTGLPSACTYGSFMAAEVCGALGKTVVQSLGTLAAPSADDHFNAAGSELDVDIVRLKGAISELTQRLDATTDQPAAWAEHHNRLVALCVVALLASTGARPVSSPFESFTWVDLDRRLIYVEDKHSGPSRGARLCILSDFAHDLLVDRYVPHLHALADALMSLAGSFAAEIRKIPSRDPSCRLPMFFLLRTDRSLDWAEVTEAQLNAVCDEPWPLPWNLFRHLHSTQLRRWNLHADIRDALLSHGDHGAEGHGDFSWRTPGLDLETARPLINRLSKELGFALPSGRGPSGDVPNPRFTDPGLTASRAYGREARRAQREKTHEAARQRACSDIDRALGARPPSSLSADDWDKVARKMLLREDGLPHAMASLRYEVFEDRLSALWRDDAVQVVLSHRRVPIREGSSLFTEDVIAAPAILQDLRTAVDTLTSGLTRPPRPILAGFLAALELALHCRVGSLAVLCAVVCNSPAIRVVRHASRYWLERAYRGDWKDGRPTYRVLITERAAGWIGLAQAGQKRLELLPDLPTALQEIDHQNRGSSQFLAFVAGLVGQQNALKLPGMMAAVLNGQRESSSLPHSDWVRTLEGLALAIAEPDSPLPGDGAHLETDEQFFRHHHRAAPTNGDNALARCRTLFAKIQAILSEARLPRKAGSSDGSDWVAATPVRRSTEIARAVKASGFGSGDAPFVLAHYASHLLARPKRRNSGQNLKASTGLRYWYALAPGMLDFAFDANLASMDDDELTGLYVQIVNAATAPPAGPSRRRRISAGSDAGERSLAELKAFHAFACTIYGLEDPDWSEVSPELTVGAGRPGVVLPEEYQGALTALIPGADPAVLDDGDLASAFVLMSCARFGLRTSEALGLHRADWVELAGTVVVLVRSNSNRSLKTIRSKRQVPLVGALSDLERALVREVTRRWDHREGANRATPLLADFSNTAFKHHKSRISAKLLALLKSITRNPATTVHHLRHSFASRLLALLCGRPFGMGATTWNFGETLATRRLLLGGDSADRRTLWAVARCTGHASPSVLIKSYLHVVDCWLPRPQTRAPVFAIVDQGFVFDLDTETRVHDYLAGPFETKAILLPSEPLFLRYLRYCRLRTIGHRNPGIASNLDAEQSARLELYLTEAAQRLTGKAASRQTVKQLLASISDKRWKVLVELAKSSSSKPLGDISDWAGTIGANRQILMFVEEHFRWVASFLQSLGPAGRNLAIVRGRDLHPALEEQLRVQDLLGRTLFRDEWAKGFQLDVASIGSPERTYRHRVALMAGAPFDNSIELLVAWVAWLTANATDY